MLYEVDVIFIGSSDVGKTSIVKRYCDDIFTGQSNTIGFDLSIKEVEIDNNQIKVCSCRSMYTCGHCDVSKWSQNFITASFTILYQEWFQAKTAA